MTGEATLQRGEKYLMPTYSRYPVVLVRGKGARVWDDQGRCYLDFLSGIAVNALGHCHPRVVAAIREQAGELIHCSNLYWSRPQVELAGRLAGLSGLDRVFFCNSGAEANEAAIKLVRRYGYEHGKTSPEIITFSRAFHGRTLGTLAATGQAKFAEGFTPLPGGFRHLPFNNVEALRQGITPETVAILVEPVQGEGGVYPASQEFMNTLGELRRKYGVLLVYDEVQCGMGRTGRMFAFEHYGVAPDVLVLAKALGGGLPMGAVVAREEVAAVFRPGSHGSTFGGNPVACAAALAMLQVMQEEHLVERAAEVGDYFRRRLEELKGSFPVIREVRGYGLMLGMELDRPGQELVARCAAGGLLANCTAERVLRFLPPLIIGRSEVEEAISILTRALEE